jgi:CarD family transcriptional regulator
MLFTVGVKVVYPSRGPCLIGEVVKKVVGGQTMKFYPLALLDDSKGELFVPVENIADSHLRALLDRSEIPQLLRRLEKIPITTKKPGPVKNWRQRNTDNAKLLNSGSAFDLAAVIESLTSLNEAKSLSPYEREMMARARKLLVCEISEVTGESKSVVEEQITDALHLDKTV